MSAMRVKLAQVKVLLPLVDDGVISASRMAELLGIKMMELRKIILEVENDRIVAQQKHNHSKPNS